MDREGKCKGTGIIMEGQEMRKRKGSERERKGKVKGGIKGGVTIGETDDFGYNVAKDKVEVHDLHATMLHLLGIDHERLIYKFKGRDFRLTDVAGNVVQALDCL